MWRIDEAIKYINICVYFCMHLIETTQKYTLIYLPFIGSMSDL